MSTAVAWPPPVPKQKLVNGEQRFVLHGVPWASYVAIGEALRNWPGLWITYDRGTMEFMTKSLAHESYVQLLVQLVYVWVEELNIRVRGGGQTTMQREDLERALEPDNCFWFKNLTKIRGKRELDLNRDPPPDLVIEGEVSRSTLDRIAMWAAIGVAELWRFDGLAIRILRLTRGEYKESKASRLLPTFPFQDVPRFVQLAIDEDDTTMVRKFRKWVREHLAE